MQDKSNIDQTETRPLTSLAQTLFWAVLSLIAVVVLVKLADVALLIFAAAMIGTILRGGAEKLSQLTTIPPWATLTFIVLALLALFGGVLWFQGPTLATEISQLATQLNTEIKNLWGRAAETSWGQDLAQRVQKDGNNLGQSALGFIKGFASNTLGVVAGLAVLTVAALYFAAAPEVYVGGTLRLLPLRWRARGQQIFTELALTLRWWFIGQAIDMMVIGVLTTIGLTLLHVPLAGTLGLIAAICNFVPYIGTFTGAVPALIVALAQGPDQALWVAGLFTFVQALEGYLVAPLVQRSTVHLPPVLTILSQTVLGTLLGPLGLILATPLTAAGMVLTRMIYVEDLLGDHELEKSDPQPAGGGSATGIKVTS